MQLKNVTKDSFVVMVKAPKFFCQSVLSGQDFVVDEALGYAILATYNGKIEKQPEVPTAKAYAKSPADKSLEVKLS